MKGVVKTVASALLGATLAGYFAYGVGTTHNRDSARISEYASYAYIIGRAAVHSGPIGEVELAELAGATSALFVIAEEGISNCALAIHESAHKGRGLNQMMVQEILSKMRNHISKEKIPLSGIC